MNLETLIFTIENSVATITINRPNDANAMNLQLAKELAQAAMACDQSPGVRAVILTGTGKMFSAGGDLASFADAGNNVGSALKELTTYLHGAISTFSRMNAPLIVAVNGVAAGAGFSLVAAGDYCIASSKAKFTMAYTGAGLSPDCGASFYLPPLIGLRRTKELMLTNRLLKAEEALEWGILNEVVEPDELQSRALEFASQIATGPTKAFGAVKSLLLTSYSTSLETQLELEARAISRLGAGEDGQEGISAFLAKRKAVFSGNN